MNSVSEKCVDEIKRFLRRNINEFQKIQGSICKKEIQKFTRDVSEKHKIDKEIKNISSKNKLMEFKMNKTVKQLALISSNSKETQYDKLINLKKGLKEAEKNIDKEINNTEEQIEKENKDLIKFIEKNYYNVEEAKNKADIYEKKFDKYSKNSIRRFNEIKYEIGKYEEILQKSKNKLYQ